MPWVISVGFLILSVAYCCAITPAEWVDGKVAEIAQGATVDHWEAFRKNVSDVPLDKTNIVWGDSLTVAIYALQGTNPVTGFADIYTPVKLAWNWSGTNVPVENVFFKLYSTHSIDPIYEQWTNFLTVAATNAFVSGSNYQSLVDWTGTITFYKATAISNADLLSESNPSNIDYQPQLPSPVEITTAKP